jgi:hypothetical protein
MNFKEKYARRKLNKLIGQQKHEAVLPELNQKSVIGVIWQPTEKSALQFLHDYYNKKGVIFRDFCIFDNTSNPAHETNSLSSKDLNWWGIPKPEFTNEFLNVSFDILFCLALNHNFQTDYMVALSKAKFKIGSSVTNNNLFDLNIKIEENQDAKYLAEQQLFYLSQLLKKQ